jgi:hypothetical protein
MPDTPDRSDIRALARVILEQEERDQSAMRTPRPRYELHPVRRRFVKGLRSGLLVGVALGLASSGLGTTDKTHPFHPADWLLSFALFSVVGTVVGALAGALIGMGVRWWQRHELDTALDSELRDLARGRPS